MTAELGTDGFSLECARPNRTEALRVPRATYRNLFLGNCRGHPLTSGPTYGNSFVTYLPAKRTSLIQPVNQGITQKFKSGLLGIFHSQITEFCLQCVGISGLF